MKKNYSINLSLILGVMFAINANNSVFASSFNDVSNHWAKDSISRIENFNIINGFNGYFRPNEHITRGELAVILDNIMAYQNKSDNTYNDLDNSFYTDSILKLTKANIISGYNNDVRPKDYITREEAVTMIARAFQTNADVYGVDYKDSSKISEWAMSSISALTHNDVIKGNNNEFRPKDNITRAEVVTILNNILGGYYNSAGTFSNENTDKTVVVSASDVKLENITIDKDLIISAGVGEGDVTLSNVTVKGKTVISGGGSHSIHIEGNSSLKNIEMAKDGSPIRIVAKDNSSVGNIILKEQNADTIVEGNVDSIQSLSSNKNLEIRGQVNNLTINGDNSNVNLTQNAKVKNVVSKSSNNNFNLSKGTTIANMQNYSNTNIKGEGNVSNIQNQSSSSSTSTLIGGGSSTSSNSSSDKVEYPKIVSVESVKNGLVRFKLDKAYDGSLTKDMLSIICTSGGSDMTVLNVRTKDNITFDVTTAYYKDNSYSLAIVFPDKTITDKDFEVRSLAPTISSIKVERSQDDKANILYISDTPGKLHYVLRESKNTRLLDLSSDEITEEYVVKNGTTLDMKTGGNTVDVSNLKKDTPYKFYYVAEDLGGNRSVLKEIHISGETENIPENSVQILTAEGFYKNNGFFKENHWFEFELSDAVALNIGDFTITCPSSGKLTIGRLESSDNIHYKVYMKPGYVPASDNTYTATIALPDGNTAKKSFFVDFDPPHINGIKINRLSESTAEVNFNSSESGWIHWKILPLSEVSQDTKPKDPNKIIEGGTKVKLNTGFNRLDLSGLDTTQQVFCYVTEDEKGNIMQFFDYPTIPTDITKPEIPDSQESFKFKVVKISDGYYLPKSTDIQIETDEEVYISIDDVEVKNKDTGKIYKGHKEISTTNPSNSTTSTVTVRKKLEAGNYEIKITKDNKVGTQDFEVTSN